MTVEESLRDNLKEFIRLNGSSDQSTFNSWVIHRLAELYESHLFEVEREELEMSEEKKLSCRVSQKKACSVYGLGRFPVTLYREQWTALSEFIPEVMKFIEDHDEELKVKEDKKAKEIVEDESSDD